MSLKQLWQVWSRFWFADGSPIPVALFRIIVGFLVLQFCWGISADVIPFFGPNAMVSAETSATWFGPAKFNLFSCFPAISISTFYWLLVAAALFLTVGLFSKVSAFAVYLLLLSFQSQNNLAIYNILELLFLMALCLAFSRGGDALSFDRLLRIWRRTNPEFGPAEPGSIVGQRLIQLQLILIYWGAFSSKLQGTTWMDGTAIYYATHSMMFQQLQFAHLHLFDRLWLCQILSWSTLVLEFMLITLIWIRECRYPVLMLGLCFHTGMELSLSIPLLQPIMVSGYITFIAPADLTRAINLFKRFASRLFGSPAIILFDEQSDLSRRVAETIRRLDVFGNIRLTGLASVLHDTEQTKAASSGPIISGLASNNRQLTGVHLLRLLACRLPLLLPVYPLSLLPGSRWALSAVGSRLRQRYRDKL
jgi:hypothetical protein